MTKALPIYASVVHGPYGVVAGILPPNRPPVHVGGKAAPALAAGNTIILKPGKQALLTALRIVEILQVSPPDVIQAVPQRLVSHPDVKKVSFTGSTKAGAAVGKSAAETITRLSLELGGKNAILVFDDADLNLAVRNALDGGFFNQREACTASSHLLVQKCTYNAFVNQLAGTVK